MLFFSKPKGYLVLQDVVAYRGTLSWTCAKFWAWIRREEGTHSDRLLFSGSPRSFTTQQTGEEGHNVGTELLRAGSPLCGQRESVVGRTNFDVGTKKLVGQGTMTPKCALQMRSTFGTDILMQKTGSF